MGKGQCDSTSAGILVVHTPRNAHCITDGVYTDYKLALVVPSFEKSKMALHSTTQGKKSGIGFDTGTDASDPGSCYAKGKATQYDIDANLEELPNGKVRRSSQLVQQKTIGVPLLDSITQERVTNEKLLQFDQVTGLPFDPSVAFKRMMAGVSNTPYEKVAKDLADQFINEPDPVELNTCLFSTFVPRPSALSRAARVAKQTASTVGQHVTFMSMLTVAVLCGGLCTVGAPTLSNSLGMEVIHYCDSDPKLREFVSEQNPKAMLHSDAYEFRDDLRNQHIPCAFFGTAPPLDVFELTSPCWTRTSLVSDDVVVDWSKTHELFLRGSRLY